MSFKVGDEVISVTSPHYGIGTVVSITNSGIAGPVVVKWSNTERETAYRQDGTQIDQKVRLKKPTKLERVLRD